MDPLDPSLLRDPIPLFPLPNCVLLPGTVLPLRVFEPRYLTMTHELLCRPVGKRLVAIAMLIAADEGLYHTNHPRVRRVVGLGEMVQHTTTEDGCRHILVHGRSRARIALEDKTGVYRKAILKPLPTEPGDMLSTVAASVDEVRELFAKLADAGVCDRELVETIATRAGSVAAMIDLGASHMIESDAVAVKQRILEEERLEVRAEILALHLRGLLDSSRAPLGHGDPGRVWPPRDHLN